MNNVITENGEMIQPCQQTQTSCVPELVKQNAGTENIQTAAGSIALTAGCITTICLVFAHLVAALLSAIYLQQNGTFAIAIRPPSSCPPHS